MIGLTDNPGPDATFSAWFRYFGKAYSVGLFGLALFIILGTFAMGRETLEFPRDHLLVVAFVGGFYTVFFPIGTAVMALAAMRYSRAERRRRE